MAHDEGTGLLGEEPRSTLDLWDWRRQMATLYSIVRSVPPEEAWHRWRDGRDRLLREHPQSPVPEVLRASFPGLPLFDYDPDLRVVAAVEPIDPPAQLGLPHSGAGLTRAVAFGSVRFEIDGVAASLPIYRLLAYGDGIFLPFRDATSGAETYGGGRYLIDTVKGADLGASGAGLILDFNFAYHPSCVHDPEWSCPLAPLANTLTVAIHAGERLGP
jgi:hypothetical protein